MDTDEFLAGTLRNPVKEAIADADLIVRPNPGLNFSAANYEAKATRWKMLWPELRVLPADAV